jgi:hypothetical protein
MRAVVLSAAALAAAHMGTGMQRATCDATSGGHWVLQMGLTYQFLNGTYQDILNRFVRLFAGHGNHVRCMAFLGSKVISGSDDRTIRV